MKEGEVKVVWRHLAFLGQESLWAAQACECARDQDKFWEYHDKLFAAQSGRNGGTFSKANLKRFATELGLDSGRFDPCIDSDRYAAFINAETEAARKLGVQSTPTLFVNGQVLRGVPTYEQLVDVIRNATR